ncbi:hypothetical protein MKW94_027255 [Papaver nudicaule]|uniref:Cullin N-terminal domain-containing protein n=1 Tax=Papaver nudicaule TaxID=74823 RepID=A0AA41S5L7_PAPNU|nr:hypothetical protein [Papaver nudicaule]
MNKRVAIELEEGWEIIQMGITKLINILEGDPNESPMDVDYHMKLYTMVFSMCNQRTPRDYSNQLYERYEGVYNNYLQSKVLPAVQKKHDDDDVSMLQELVRRWENHKVLVTKLRKCFYYLDLSYVPRNRLPTLRDVGFSCFREIVGEEMKVRVKDAVILLINQERRGEEIDRTLLKNVVQIFVDFGNKYDDARCGTQNREAWYDEYLRSPAGSVRCNRPAITPSLGLEYYVNDFETAFLNNTADYYTRKASNWTKEDYTSKAEECLKKEKNRVSHYLHSSTEEKLLKRVQDVLNAAAADQTIA